MSGVDGLYVVVQSLSDVKFVVDIKVMLLFCVNWVLFDILIDGVGYVCFDVGFICGIGGVVFVLFLLEQGDDIVFFLLIDLVFDFFDCGVEGCLFVLLLDLFVMMDRGVYCVGEIIYVIVLLCGDQVEVIQGLLIMVIIKCFDGVEYMCIVLIDDQVGGCVFEIFVVSFVLCGNYVMNFYLDIKFYVFVVYFVLVEDFILECIDFDLFLFEGFLCLGDCFLLNVVVKYLFGVSGVDLLVDG